MISLIKKDISGYGAYHAFKDSKTGEALFEKCTQEEYDRMGEPGGAKYNPIKDGYEWTHSFAGSPEVEGRLLGEREYIELPNGSMFAKINDQTVELQTGDVDASGNFVGLISP